MPIDYRHAFHDGYCDFVQSRNWSMAEVERGAYRRALRLRKPIRLPKTKAIVADRLNLAPFRDEDLKHRILVTGRCLPQLERHPEQILEAKRLWNMARHDHPDYPVIDPEGKPLCDWRSYVEGGISPYDSRSFLPKWSSDLLATPAPAAEGTASAGGPTATQGAKKRAPAPEPKPKWKWSDPDPKEWDYWDKDSPDRDHEEIGQLLRSNVYPGYTYNYNRKSTAHSDYNADVYKRRGHVTDEFRMQWDELSRWGEQNIKLNSLKRLWNAPKEK